MRIWMLVCGVVGTMVVAGCGDSGSGSGTSGTTQPGVTEQVMKHAGEELKQAATQVGAEAKAAAARAETQVGPKLEQAKEEAKAAIHEAAQKVSDMTATQPATGPGN